MTRFLTSLVAAGSLLALGGVCQANGVDQPIRVQPGAGQATDQAVVLGAGDALGRACYSHYVAVVRAEQHRSIYQTQGPAPMVRPASHQPLIARASQSPAEHGRSLAAAFLHVVHQAVGLITRDA